MGAALVCGYQDAMPMDSQKTVMLQLNILIQVPSEDTDTLSHAADILTDHIKRVLGDIPSHARWISTGLVYLDDSDLNSGRCTVCGIWVTDDTKPDPVPGLHWGASVNEQIFCEQHYPWTE